MRHIKKEIGEGIKDLHWPNWVNLSNKMNNETMGNRDSFRNGPLFYTDTNICAFIKKVERRKTGEWREEGR